MLQMQPEVEPMLVTAAFMFPLALTSLTPQDVEQAQPLLDQESNTVLMHATFQISGVANSGKIAAGTVFVIGRPITKTQPPRAAYTLVTAKHVLDNIASRNAVLHLRLLRKDGTYQPMPWEIPIRQPGGSALYTSHPTEDISVMYLNLPNVLPFSLLPEEALADDNRLASLAFHPGDDVLCLGFPLSESLPGGAGFPIMRSGRVASYPVYPAKIAKRVLVDISLYPGYSGGPAYFSSTQRQIKNSIAMGSFFGILGVVTQIAEPLPEFPDKPMNIAVIVPAHYIRETLALLPPPQDDAVASRR
jgi:hypothetical protein